MPFLKSHSRSLVLLGVLAAGIIIVAPYTNYQDYLSQGDHGRDLYAAQAVYRGELPYKDFWWVYGPLTPYYYGLFFKIFGTKISSMILGKLILRISGGLLMALALMEIASASTAFFAGCWFMLFQQDFFFTYNHIAGLAMGLGVMFCLLSYIKKSSSQAALSALGFVFVLCLIKVNFGLAALVGTLITVTVCDFLKKEIGRRPYFYILALIGLPLAVFLIYWSLLHGLTTMEIRQCLPYKEGDQPYSTSPWRAIADFLRVMVHTISSNWMNLSFAVIINASFIRCVYLFVRRRFSCEEKRILGLSFGLILMMYVFNMHEYLKSGVWYRGFWAQPLSIMLIFLLIEIATKDLPSLARKIIFTFIAFFCLFGWFSSFRAINSIKTESQYLGMPRGGVYISNEPRWIQTVEQTTDFLNHTLKKDELFFALPYDCLYYYLTDKRSPTRQLIFFEHIKIPAEQEKSVIAELEKNHVNYVLISNRAFAHQELGLGQFGLTYCPLLGKYVMGHFTPVARFGDWTHEPGWAWNHGTVILKRK